MSTATATPLRPARGANFTSKSARKRYRKGLVRGYVSNKVAEVKSGAAARADFYRNLRQMKERRIMIARELATLQGMIATAVTKASTVPPLVEDLKTTTPAHKKAVKDLLQSADEAVSAGQAASRSVSGVADEFAAFAKRRIWFGGVL